MLYEHLLEVTLIIPTFTFIYIYFNMFFFLVCYKLLIIVPCPPYTSREMSYGTNNNVLEQAQ